MPHVKIDPAKIKNKAEYDLLRCLFEQEQGVDVFSKLETFKLGDTSFQLTHTLLLAPRHNPDQTTYHIISSRSLGEGVSGKVYPVKLDLLFSVNQRTITSEKSNPPQVVKYQFVRSFDNISIPQEYKNRWNNEYEHSKQGHLNAEIPTFKIHEGTGMEMFLPMNRMPGMEFFYFLSFLSDPRNHVSSYVRFLLTFEVLNKFYEQVVYLKKVHGDLKPENMMFDIKNDLSNKALIPKWELNIIDFEGSESFGFPRKFFSGTLDYLAPETRAIIDELKPGVNPTYPAVHDEKLDLVSVAIIIGIFWGIEPSDRKKLTMPEELSELISKQKNLYFYDETEAFSSSFLAPIYAGIACMIDPDLNKRWNLEQSNMFFEDLFSRYKAMLAPMRHSDSMILEGIFDDVGYEDGEKGTQPSPVGIEYDFDVLDVDVDDQDGIIAFDRKPQLACFELPSNLKDSKVDINEIDDATCGCALS